MNPADAAGKYSAAAATKHGRTASGEPACTGNGWCRTGAGKQIRDLLAKKQ